MGYKRLFYLEVLKREREEQISRRTRKLMESDKRGKREEKKKKKRERERERERERMRGETESTYK